MLRHILFMFAFVAVNINNIHLALPTRLDYDVEMAREIKIAFYVSVGTVKYS